MGETDVFLLPASLVLCPSPLQECGQEDFGMLLEAAVMYDRRVAAILGEGEQAQAVSGLPLAREVGKGGSVGTEEEAPKAYGVGALPSPALHCHW